MNLSQYLFNFKWWLNNVICLLVVGHRHWHRPTIQNYAIAENGSSPTWITIHTSPTWITIHTKTKSHSITESTIFHFFFFILEYNYEMKAYPRTKARTNFIKKKKAFSTKLNVRRTFHSGCFVSKWWKTTTKFQMHERNFLAAFPLCCSPHSYTYMYWNTVCAECRHNNATYRNCKFTNNNNNNRE